MGEISEKVQERRLTWCEKRGALRRKERDGNGSTREKEERRPKRRWLDRVRDDIKEK